MTMRRSERGHPLWHGRERLGRFGARGDPPGGLCTRDGVDAERALRSSNEQPHAFGAHPTAPSLAPRALAFAARPPRRLPHAIAGGVIAETFAPGSAKVPLDESTGRRIWFAVGRIGDERGEDASEKGTLVGVVTELGVGEEGVEDAEVGVFELRWRVSGRTRNARKVRTPSLSSPRSESSRRKTSTRTQRSFV